ncbi:MAG: hydantoinase/oxoprolinase family protein [Chloroflexi bacterium]|nr:hydantoinase/oxoprolinase family protein [Chloroflexota bacterium]
MYRVCIDVGGTFTDCLVLDGHGQVRQFKSPTTPADASVGFLSAVAKAARGYGQDTKTFLGSVELLVHGTTLATNTLINTSGAKTGMITTKGFRDVVETRRGYKNVRTSMYNVFVPPYRPLVPRRLRLEAEERSLYTGEVATALREDDVRAAARKLRAEGVESVAICFLHSYAQPANERRATELARAEMPGTYVTSSHEILPVWREFERFSTTAVSAYTGPVVERYLRSLEARLAASGFRGQLLLMLSSGVVETVDYCVPRVVYLIGSGPAAAPAAALHAGAASGRRDLLSVDMGGTSFDVCMIRGGEIPTTTEGWVQDERVAIKMVDVHSAGAGGGSIAWIDSIGLLRVGPRSAGGDPGPACYGKGLDPTVTDADLLLGYVPADFFLGGDIKLDATRAEAAMMRVGTPLGMTARDAAQAVFTAVNSFMADQITEVATMGGHDVRDFALVGGGGAGPVHVSFIAELLGIPTVIVPSVAATYSAFGMLAMDIGRHYSRSYVVRAKSLDLERVRALYREMEQQAVEGLGAMGIARDAVAFTRTADLRYVGQFHEVEVEVPSGELSAAAMERAIENFHARHKALYTFNMPWQAVEFLTFHQKATVPRPPFSLRRVEPGGRDASAAVKRRRTAWFGGVPIETTVFDGSKLRAGNVIAGPALIEETTTTVVVPPSFTVVVDEQRSYVLTLGERAGTRGRTETRAVEGVSR